MTSNVISDDRVSKQHDIIIIIIIIVVVVVVMTTATSSLLAQQLTYSVLSVVHESHPSTVAISTYQQVMHWTSSHHQHLRPD